MRQFHTANIIENKMYVFGGGDGKSWLNELMILDLVNLDWKGPLNFPPSGASPNLSLSNLQHSQGELNSSEAPSGRLQHSSVASDSKIYIFGGEPDQFRQLNDIWCLDTKSLQWEQPQTMGQEPSARVSSTGCLVDNKIYYFGGYDGVQWLNDVHSFDIYTNRWERINIPGSYSEHTSQPSIYPIPRCRHTLTLVKGLLYVYGGNDSENSFQDLWALQIGIQVPEPKLHNDMRGMLESGLHADVTFVLEGGQKMKAHKCIIASRCEVFSNMFLHSMKEQQEAVITVQDVTSQTFKYLLEYIYTDQLNPQSLEVPDQVIELLIAANKYDLERLKRLCEKHLVSLIDIDSALELLQLSDRHQGTELKRKCINFCTQHLEAIKVRDEFRKLSKSILLDILQSK